MAGDSSASGESDAIVEALKKQEMQLVDAVALEPELEPTPPTGVRRRGAPNVPARQSATLQIDVEPGEEAVVLVEQDGVYSWVFPTRRADIAARGAPRRARAVPGLRRVTFRIDMHASSTPQRRRDRRGFFTDLVYSKVKAFVLKFAARIVVGQAMKFLERNVSRGIVVIDSDDPQRWRRVDDFASLRLPQDRPARVLLLVHGTFSSTAGSFGALGATPWGREFLAGARASYDVVIGFDHPTLSEDPLENAVDLLGRLQRGTWPHPPQVDAVAFSRGALVLRSLIEHLLPAANWSAHFQRAVFVGCTNGGTALANPDNWHALIDLYTNLATAVTRLIAMMPQASAPMKILSEVIQGLGSLVKYMATESVTRSSVPGLAAMQPDGDFITEINKTQPGQPTPEKTWFYAVTAQFEARVLDGNHEPKELPRRLVLALADGFVDQLMKNAPNDLVVDTRSMTRIDPQAGRFVRDTFDFGSTPQVYHLNYFTRPEVTNALARWLQLVAPAKAGRKTGALRIGPLPPRTTSAGISQSDVPAVVDTDILVTDVMAPVHHTIAEIESKAPSSVVLRRPYEGKILNYAMSTEVLLDRLKRRGGEEALLYALDLHESQQTKSRPLSAVRRIATPPEEGGVEVVLAGDEPVGVMVRGVGVADSDRLVHLARRTINPKAPKDRILARRALPTFSLSRPLGGAAKYGLTSRLTTPSRSRPPSATRSLGLGTSRTRRPIRIKKKAAMKKGGGGRRRRDHASTQAARRKAPAPPTVTCHFRAEMEEEVLLKRVTTVEVNVSREVIGGIVHAAAAESSVGVDPTHKLLVQVIPKRNFELAGEEDRVEIDPPEPEKPRTFYFDVRATHDVGGEGELWVVARQGQIPLVRLTLRPRIVAKRPASAHRTTSTATATEARPLAEPLTQLFITEQVNGSELRYRFQLQSPKLGILAWDVSKAIRGSRTDYVNRLYSEIENRWISTSGDVDDFYAELRAYGAELFDELVPGKIQRALWQHRARIDSIMVIAEEPFIPWEVVHLTEPGKSLTKETRFFGEMGLVRWLEEAGWPEETIPLGTARYVIPKYPHRDYELPEALQEAEFLKKKFGAKEVQPTAAAVRRLLAKPGAFDLLHFACHGEAEQSDTANAALLLQGRVEGGNYIPEYFNATTAEYHSNFRRDGLPGPMIVLNACQVGRASYKLTGTGGFARAFLRRGASAFVGTLWSVGDWPARTFTEEFYTHLKCRKAHIADATKAARAKAKKAGDATWLAYVVYGHPHARYPSAGGEKAK